jgi:3-hydroxybutyryl-CoA dehydrogenase
MMYRSLVRKCPIPPVAARMSAKLKSVGVFGAGQMGTGIAIVAARYLTSSKIHVFDPFQTSLDQSRKFMETWGQKEIKKGRMNDNEYEQFLSRISHHELSTTSHGGASSSYSDSIEDMFSEIDFAIEAVPESFELKEKLLREFEKNCKFDSIFATNTSSISITRIAAASIRPDKIIGMHFMNPVPVMPLVEIIRGLSTSESTLKCTMDLCKAFNKTPATSIDRPGFIANRLLMPYINEAIFALQEGVSTRDDIDKIMKLGTNMPMGPLELADFIGLDTCLSIMRVLHTEFGDSKYRPAPLLVQMVTAKKLGRKTNEGFYLY